MVYYWTLFDFTLNIFKQQGDQLNASNMSTVGCGELLTTWITIFAYLISFSRSEHRGLWCPIAPDDIFHGTLVDCSSKGLHPSDMPIIDIPVGNTTSLLLDYNNLPYITNRSFFRLKKLRRLQIDYSGIAHIEIDAFEGLTELQILSLYGNSLNIVHNALPFGVFHHTLLLQELNIGFNAISIGSGNYSDYIDIFSYLRKLCYLHISSFPTLYIGTEFEKLSSLERLDVDGLSLLYILNSSLEGLHYSNVKHFKLSFAEPYEFGQDVFKGLPNNISSLTLDGVLVGNTNLLGAMGPLQRRQIPVLYFNNVSIPSFTTPRLRIDDGIFDQENLKFLLNICVFNLTWTNSNLLILDIGFNMNSTFASCIKSIDLSGNKLQLYELVLVSRLVALHSLEEISLSLGGLPKHVINFWDENEGNILESISQDDHQIIEFQIDSPLVSLEKGSKINYSLPTLSSPSNLLNDLHQDTDNELLPQKTNTYRHNLKGFHFVPSKTDPQDSSLSSNLSNVFFTNTTRGQRIRNGSLYIRLPEHLQYMSFDTVRGVNFGKFYEYLIVQAPNNVTELYYRYVRWPAIIKCLILGLKNVRLIDLTGTWLEQIPLAAFDFFPSLQVLVLRETQKDPSFFQIHLRRLIKNIANLVYLDLSDNGLDVLPKGIFQENRLLRYLCLAKNRLSSIPFQIQLTPSLEILDLRMNAFSGLDKDERGSIDRHITMSKEENFTLLLEDNNLQCTCSDLRFQAWMQRTYTRFDPKEHLTCLGEDGKSVRIESFSDMEQMWRKCFGQYYFLLSLLLFFAMIVLYLMVFLISMYRTYIIGKLKQIFVPEFQPQTRQDFIYDVFIGYAEEDCIFVRFQLLRYLEGVLKLKAFVHQRDLRQDRLDLGSALKDSWRTLLVITEAFLAQEMSANIMKTATFFESPSKRESIIIMVTQDLLYTIPDYVLRVVKDENIIVLPDLETPFSYEATETLRTRILC